ncbi:CvpA family protein [bacterium]|nr:CvpA family protein [bacterium]
MSVQDITIIVVIGIFALWGWWRGIIREAFDAAGLIIGVLAARQFAPVIGAAIQIKFVPQLMRTIVLSIIILLVVWIAILFVGYLVRKIIRHGPVKSLDKIGGFLVGMLKGGVIILALAILIAITPLGTLLDITSGKSPIYNTVMKVAKPLANRYRDVLGKSVKMKVAKAIPAVISSIDPDKVKDAVKKLKEMSLKIPSLETGAINEISSLKISLDTISPATERVIREILKDQEMLGVDMSKLFDKLKESGTTLDIPLEDLSPEAQDLVKQIIEDPGSVDPERLKP